MSILGEILATWRRPAAPLSRLMAAGPRENRSLIILIGAGLLNFVAQMPYQSRRAALDPDLPLQGAMGITFFVMLFILPLLAYLLAWICHLIMRAFGRQGAAHAGRLALFWAMLAITPGLLLHGLLLGLLGPEVPAVRVVGLAIFGVFLWFWVSGLRLAYFEKGKA